MPSLQVFKTLRAANIARQKLWDPDGFASNVDWRVNELCGEVGEVCNIIKKLHRERCGVRGSRATKDDLADELADAIICLDLLAMEITVSVVVDYQDRDSVWLSTTEMSLPRLGGLLGACVGVLAQHVLTGSSVMVLNEQTVRCVRIVRSIAAKEDINLQMAVIHKFNATSAKQGLPVEMYELEAA